MGRCGKRKNEVEFWSREWLVDSLKFFKWSGSREIEGSIHTRADTLVHPIFILYQICVVSFE